MQLSASEPIELSRIYPTPPSVENNEGEKFEDVKIARAEGTDHVTSASIWENVIIIELVVRHRCLIIKVTVV